MLSFADFGSALAASRNYVMMHYASLPERLQPHILRAVNDMAPVPSIVRSMEVLYAVTQEEGAAPGDLDGPTGLLNTLGAICDFVIMHNFDGKRDRAAEIQLYCKFHLGEARANAKAPTPVEIEQDLLPVDPVVTPGQPEE